MIQIRCDGCGVTDLNQNSKPDCEESKLRNSGFSAETLTPWVPDSGTEGALVFEDAQNVWSSAAVSVTNPVINPTSDAHTLGGTTQGVYLPNAERGLRLLAEANIPDAQGEGGRPRYSIFSGAACNGQLLSSAQSPLLTKWAPGHLDLALEEPPPASRSIRVRLLASKPFSAPPLRSCSTTSF